MFSFFAVPILLGDITLDFMKMIDVMVDIMVMATGTGTGMGGNYILLIFFLSILKNEKSIIFHRQQQQ